MNKYEQRLYNEWHKHGKIILALDFDSTISPWGPLDNGEDIEQVIKTAKIAKETGCYLVIFSACKPNRFDEIRQYCKEAGLQIDSINENPIDLPYGQDKKIYYNLLIDDRAGLQEALKTLDTVMWKIRSERTFDSYKKLNCIDP